MHHFRPWQPKSLFTRFFLSFLVTLTISALAIILLMPQQIENRLVDAAEKDLVNKLDLVRPTILMYLNGRLSYAEVQTNLSILESLLGGTLYIVDATGTIRVASEEYGNTLLRQRVSDEDLAALQEGEQITRREESSVMTIAMPIFAELRTPVGSQRSFYGGIYLQVPLEALRTIALVARQQVRVMPLIVCSFAMLISAIVAHSLSQPLQRMNSAALRIARGDYATRIHEERDDELGQLGKSFNLLAVSLEISIRSLKDERDRFRNLILALTEGVIASDAQQRVMLLNPSAASFFNLNIFETLGKPLKDLPIPEGLLELLTSTTAKPQSGAIKNGEQVLAVTTSPLSDDTGELTAQIAVLKDITESWRLEEERRTFVANVSHELRTPLTSIQGFVEGILDETIPPEHQERYLNIIHQECIRLTRMIHELLDLSHIESGALLLNPEPVELKPLLQSIWLQTRTAAERSDVELELALDPPEPLLFADADRLEQILINLLSNALKFTPPGSCIEVKSHLCSGSSEESERMQIEICDQGPGIAAEDLPYIWDRFFKGDRSRSSSGTGLGLAIVHSLVEAHQESIWVENREPGAAFCFTMKMG